MNKIEFITAFRHACWVSYQIAAGQPYNVEINEDQRESLMDGVLFQLNNPDITFAENHNNWMAAKVRQGWVYGPVKDSTKKTHPDLIEFDMLPDIEKLKHVSDKISHQSAVKLWDEM